MTPFTAVPRQVEDLIERASGHSRRDFLKTSGLFVVSLGVVGPGATDAAAQGAGPLGPVEIGRLANDSRLSRMRLRTRRARSAGSNCEGRRGHSNEWQ